MTGGSNVDSLLGFLGHTPRTLGRAREVYRMKISLDPLRAHLESVWNWIYTFDCPKVSKYLSGG